MLLIDKIEKKIAMMKKGIALAANYAYLNNAETTIKSILWHNPVAKIYLFNYDIPQEWFININQYAQQLGSAIIDEKFNSDLVKKERVNWKHINKLSYARFLIPSLIPEEKVLYLDSDLVVVSQLDSLFNIPFESKMILAVRDYDDLAYNSGVMMFNNKLLKKDPDLSSKLLRFGQRNNMTNGDQTVVNQYFKGQIGSLPLDYNYQIGGDYHAYFFKNKRMIDTLNRIKKPKIIHYTTSNKPYNFLSYGRMRQTWWYYRDLNWPEIVQKYTVYDARKVGPQKFKGSAFIFTSSDQIAHLKELVRALPEICFNLAAPTEMSEVLTNLIRFPNVKLYKSIIPPILKQLINNADAYLDINFGPKDKGVLNQLKKRKIPILTFNETADQNSSYDRYQVFAADDVSGMINKIKQIVQTK